MLFQVTCFPPILKGREGINGFQSNEFNKQLTLKPLKQLVPESSVKLTGSYLQVNIIQIAYSTFYMNNSRAEVYLEPCRTSTMALFCENSWRLKAVYYFRKKSSIVLVQMGSKYAFARFLFFPPYRNIFSYRCSRSFIFSKTY